VGGGKLVSLSFFIFTGIYKILQVLNEWERFECPGKKNKTSQKGEHKGSEWEEIGEMKDGSNKQEQLNEMAQYKCQCRGIEWVH
jgi:hypothetical protein